MSGSLHTLSGTKFMAAHFHCFCRELRCVDATSDALASLELFGKPQDPYLVAIFFDVLCVCIRIC